MQTTLPLQNCDSLQPTGVQPLWVAVRSVGGVLPASSAHDVQRQLASGGPSSCRDIQRVPRHSDTNRSPLTRSCAAANPAVNPAASSATLHQQEAVSDHNSLHAGLALVSPRVRQWKWSGLNLEGHRGQPEISKTSLCLNPCTGQQW